MLDLAALYRRTVNPLARRTGSVAIVSAGSNRTVFSCVCGARHTEAASVYVHGHGRINLRRYQPSYYRWAAAHAGCMAMAVSAALPGNMLCLVDAHDCSDRA